MREIAIEGLDGAGKSTIAAKLADHCRDLGETALVIAPYRMVSAEYGEIYHLWKSDHGAQTAIGLIKDAFAAGRQQAQEADADIVIFDRHWMTAFSEIAARPELVDAWGDDLVQTAYLRIAPETARERAANDTHAPWMSEESYGHYAERYRHLCQSYGAHLLGIYRNDNDVSTEALVRAIDWDMGVVR